MSASKIPSANLPITAPGMRIDIWLWAARFFKTRSLAKHQVELGRILINQLSCKPAKLVRIGDQVRIDRGTERFAIEVLALSEQRRDATAASGLYRESAQSLAAREAARSAQKLARAGFQAPASKPDKHARRALQKLQHDSEDQAWSDEQS